MRYFDANDIYIDYIRFYNEYWKVISKFNILKGNSNWIRLKIEILLNQFEMNSNRIENEFDSNWIESEFEFELNRNEFKLN